MMKKLKAGLLSLCLIQFVACSTFQKQQSQNDSVVLYPILSPCFKPKSNIQKNEDLIFALEATELALALCSIQVDSIISIQDTLNEKTK